MDQAPSTAKKQKYVLVLAHADGWGALSANKVVKHIHQQYPNVGIHLVVSQASKGMDGSIRTKLPDLKTPRALKETDLLKYFGSVDAIYDAVPTQVDLGATDSNLLTFKQLAKQYCDDDVHYTTKGGVDGGKEVAAVIEKLEKQNGHGPEVLLSVDTMAILPETLLDKYDCVSAHPGPLDTIRIEGMQGTLRSLANQILYDVEGLPLLADHVFGVGLAHIKGTLFMQHPELDKGPPIKTILSPVCPGVCAYKARDDVYDALTDAMLERLPELLDSEQRAALVTKARQEKVELDQQPHQNISELDAEQLATWQSSVVGVFDESKPWGVDVIQNEIVNPDYFKHQMRSFFPGKEEEFVRVYDEVFGVKLQALAAQKERSLDDGDPWAMLAAGRPKVSTTQYNPATGEPIATHENDASGRPRSTDYRGGGIGAG